MPPSHNYTAYIRDNAIHDGERLVDLLQLWHQSTGLVVLRTPRYSEVPRNREYRGFRQGDMGLVVRIGRTPRPGRGSGVQHTQFLGRITALGTEIDGQQTILVEEVEPRNRQVPMPPEIQSNISWDPAIPAPVVRSRPTLPSATAEVMRRLRQRSLEDHPEGPSYLSIDLANQEPADRTGILIMGHRGRGRTGALNSIAAPQARMEEFVRRRPPGYGGDGDSDPSTIVLDSIHEPSDDRNDPGIPLGLGLEEVQSTAAELMESLLGRMSSSPRGTSVESIANTRGLSGPRVTVQDAQVRPIDVNVNLQFDGDKWRVLVPESAAPFVESSRRTRLERVGEED